MLTGYFDESGHESNEHVFIAGFIGNEEQWKDAANKWRIGLGKRPGLHMRKLRWSNLSTQRLLERLGPIPKECSLIPAMGGVCVSDYEDLTTGTPWEKLDKGYFACLYPLVIRILQWLPENERIELILDKQEHYQPIAEKIFEAATKFPEFIGSDGLPKLAKWSYVPSGSTMLTQLGDYYAYALAHNQKDPKSKKSKWCSPLLCENTEPVGAIFSRKQVRNIITRVHESMNADWPNHPTIPLRGWRKGV